MSARTTRLVVEREVREAMRRKGIWALLVLVFLGASAMVILPSLFDGDDEATVALVGDDTVGIADTLEQLDDPSITVEELGDRQEAAAAIEDGKVDIALVFDSSPVLLVEDETTQLVAVVREVVTGRLAGARLTEAGIDRSAVTDAFMAATPRIELVDVEREQREGAAFGITLVLYILIVVLTSQVASGVAIEKSNRVSEVLLAIVPPRSMLVGKVLGVGCIGLTTMLAGIIPIGVRLAVGGSLPDGIARAVVASGAWFIAGLALYLTLAGALGALVSRQEEAGAVVAPLTMTIVVGYIVSISAADTALGTALAYVPLLSPMVEPYRIAIGAGSPLEYVLSLVVLLVTVVLVARVGAAVFRRAIVRTGRRLQLREVLRAPQS